MALLPLSWVSEDKAGSSSGPLPLSTARVEVLKDPVPSEEICRVWAVKVATIEAATQANVSKDRKFSSVFMKCICLVAFQNSVTSEVGLKNVRAGCRRDECSGGLTFT